MPGHDGTMMMICYRPVKKVPAETISYRILFGNISLQCSSQGHGATPIAGKHAGYLNHALDQTFDYMLSYGIASLHLRLPGDSTKKTDQLNLALNIIARFQDAVKKQSAVTFHYGDRPLVIPMVRNYMDLPDFNLTLLAGINGLSAANADELIKQAQAYHDIALSENADNAHRYKVIKDNYTQIFNVRSLRSQIIKPLVEVNTLPWDGGRTCDDIVKGSGRLQGAASGSGTGCFDPSQLDEKAPVTPVFHQPTNLQLMDASHMQKYLLGFIADDEPSVIKLKDVLLNDYGTVNTQAIAERLISASGLLYAIEKKSQDPEVVDRLLYFLQCRLLQVSDQVLSNIEVLRQGLRFVAQGRSMVVGLVHARLVDLITLVKDQVITQHKIAIVQKIAFEFAHQNAGLMVDTFDISDAHAHHLLDFFKSCFNADGHFFRDAFESRIDAMAQQADAFFEINWCFLKETPQRKDRLAFLNAIQLLMTRLGDAKRALCFLLDDLCRSTDRVDYTDRNAFVLANILLQAENKTLHVDLDRTPENLLLGTHAVQNDVRRYALWRINTDQIRVVAKIKTIHRALEQILCESGTEAGSDRDRTVEFLLALEREALIFLALVKGPTARKLINNVLQRYGAYDSEMYRNASSSEHLCLLVGQLHIVVRCMGCVGYADNASILKRIAENTQKLNALDSNPVFTMKVQQTLNWIEEAIEKIQS